MVFVVRTVQSIILPRWPCLWGLHIQRIYINFCRSTGTLGYIVLYVSKNAHELYIYISFWNFCCPMLLDANRCELEKKSHVRCNGCLFLWNVLLAVWYELPPKSQASVSVYVVVKYLMVMFNFLMTMLSVVSMWYFHLSDVSDILRISFRCSDYI